jgi:hypothetical protein
VAGLEAKRGFRISSSIKITLESYLARRSAVQRVVTSLAADELERKREDVDLRVGRRVPAVETSGEPTSPVAKIGEAEPGRKAIDEERAALQPILWLAPRL